MKTTLFLLVISISLTSCGTIGKISGNKQKKNFHIYLLLGQSNMAGRGEIESIDTIIHPRVIVLEDTAWKPAKSPLHNDKPKVAGTGMGFAFGKKIADNNEDVIIGLIPCAQGATSIDHWMKGKYHSRTDSYPYDEMLDKAKKAMLDGTIKGILWHQGESDCKFEKDVYTYENKFYKLIDSLEKDLMLSSIPIVIGELGYFLYNERPLAIEFNIILKDIAFWNRCIGLVKANDLNHKGDNVHFNSASYRILGEKYAKKMIELQFRCKKVKKRNKFFFQK
ncbi:MAG TPA: sialate O-acetylesterase [Bacteroidales bacterium]|nr:sialate O-acetylesterase [Bacteroidales bacterium]